MQIKGVNQHEKHNVDPIDSRWNSSSFFVLSIVMHDAMLSNSSSCITKRRRYEKSFDIVFGCDGVRNLMR